MAKKSSKKQPAGTSRVDANAPAITRLSFFNFITIATTEDIEKFINIAATTPEGENLKYLWERAYKEGFKNGQKVIQPTLQRIGKKLEEKFEKGVARGMDLGREEGYTLAKQGFDGIVKGLKAREAPKVDTSDAGTQTDTPATTTTSISVQTTPDMFAAMSQSPALFENGKNTIIGTTGATTSGISQNFANFSSPTSSSTVLNSPTPSTITTALETRSETANFIQKCGKVEISSFSTQMTPEILAASIIGPKNDEARVYSTPTTPNDALLQPSTSSTTVSSSQLPVLTADIRHEKSAPLRAVFESQQLTESPLTTTIVTALETRPETPSFIENHQKTEKSPISTPKTLELAVSTPFSWADDTELPSTLTMAVGFAQTHSEKPFFDQKYSKPAILEGFNLADNTESCPATSTVPTKHHRDLSCLRSTSLHPFSSLQRRRGRPKNRRNPQRRHGHDHGHSYTHSWHHPSHLHTPSPISLNWDSDPRLSDLSRSLKALGWIRAS